MFQTFDDESRERLVSLMHLQPGFGPQSNPLTFDFKTAEDAFEAVQREAIELANNFDPVEVHTFLLDLYQTSSDPWLAGQAFHILAHLQPPGGLRFLKEVLVSQDADWRCAACRTLADFPGDASSELLAHVLLTDSDPDVRWLAADSLRIVGAANAIPALQHAILYDKGEDYEGCSVANTAQEALNSLFLGDSVLGG